MNHKRAFRAPSFIERLFNRVFGVLASVGIGLTHNFQLSVVGRKSGKVYRTPVNLLIDRERIFLVSPRGEAQWVKNVRAAGALKLKRGNKETVYSAVELDDSDKILVLREYLKRYKFTVQRYFSVSPESTPEEFGDIVQYHPVFELHEKSAAV